MRTFVDESGTEWMVWEVRPRSAAIGLDERRQMTERRSAPAPDPIIERRLPDPRRVRRLDRSAAVGSGFMDGWLAFRSGGERRRLAPIPTGWQTGSDEELRAWCRAAAGAIVRPDGDARDAPRAEAE